jgi:oligogalacturonide lyase
VHYSISWDGKLFSGDGGDPGQVAYAPDGMWINLFRPQRDGSIVAERLADMAMQDYHGNNGEPNGNVTPDGKWVVFRSNMSGDVHVYAVEIARSPIRLKR